MKKVLISLACCIITALLVLLGPLDNFDKFITDPLYQSPLPVNNKIKIIAIDEKSLDSLGAYNKWDRKVYGELLDTLYKDPDNAPMLTVFDIIFQGNTNPESDTAFAQAADRAGNVITAANMVFKEAIETDNYGNKVLNRLHTDMIEYPYPELLEATSPGFANTIQDVRDNAVRTYFTQLYTGEGDSIFGISATAAARYGEITGQNVKLPPVGPGENVIIRYVGHPGDYEIISFSDIIDGKIPKEAFKDTILFVGAYAPGMMDSFLVPTGRGKMMYGVEIHANLFQSILEDRYMLRTSTPLRAAVYGLIAGIFALIAQYLPFAVSGIAGLVIIAAQCFVGLSLSKAHAFVPIITLPVCLILIEAAALIYKYMMSLMQRQKVLKAFRQYVAPQIVEDIAKKGDYELKLGGEKRHIAVLFVDIRGFTPLSESLEPEEVVAILNEYLALTTKSIFDNDGTLDKFVGDATMAVFNSPFDTEDYIYKAVCAARDIVAGSDDIRRKAFEMTGKTVGFGVGVNCGEAVVGNIGCDFRMDYTAIGDTVNTAARLEANAKAGQVLLSPAVVEALGERIEVNPVGDIPLKGKAVPMSVSELVTVRA